MKSTLSTCHFICLGIFTQDGSTWVFTVKKSDGPLPRIVQVNYDDFAEDVMIGDEVVVDGGMARFQVVEKVGLDLHCHCIDPGLLLPHAKLTFWRNGELVERNVVLPTLSAKDWIDIDFGISEGVDFIAVSFVKTADAIKHLKSYIASRSAKYGYLSFLPFLGWIPTDGYVKRIFSASALNGSSARHMLKSSPS